MTQYEVKDGVGIIPEGETVIDHSAFEDCKSLTSVIIPDSVTEIRSYAFRDCTGLKRIVIPKSVTEIWDKVFAGCTSLTSIVVSKENKVYDSRNKSNAIIETATNKLIAGCSNTVIPDSVTEIGTDAFAYCTSLKNIVIPSSVTKIGEDAFYLCTDLSSIVIPNSVKEIVMGAFSGCTGLTSIVIPDAVSIIDKVFDCCNLKSITVVDENGEAINNNNAIVSPRYRFYNDKGDYIFISNTLVVGCANTIIPENVLAIGDEVFSGCEELESIVIPKRVKWIGSGAFNYCQNLKSVVIPDSVLVIDDFAFGNCKSLETVTLGTSVVKIKSDAFFNCPALKTIYVPAKKADYYKERLPKELHSLIVELPAEKSESKAEK